MSTPADSARARRHVWGGDTTPATPIVASFAVSQFAKTAIGFREMRNKVKGGRFRSEDVRGVQMHVISQKRLRKFWERYPDAEEPLRAWYKIASRSSWENFAEIKSTFSISADRVGKCTVFNIGGNKFRLVVKIEFQWGRIDILRVLTHKEYDQVDWDSDCR